MNYVCKYCKLSFFNWRMINNNICIDCFRRGMSENENDGKNRIK